MTLEEVEYMTGVKVTVSETVAGQRVASMRGVEILDGFMMIEVCGFGKTYQAARNRLVKRISWQTLVKGAYSQNRKEWDIPKVSRCK